MIPGPRNGFRSIAILCIVPSRVLFMSLPYAIYLDLFGTRKRLTLSILRTTIVVGHELPCIEGDCICPMQMEILKRTLLCFIFVIVSIEFLSRNNRTKISRGFVRLETNLLGRAVKSGDESKRCAAVIARGQGPAQVRHK